jgi:hypothetical protein
VSTIPNSLIVLDSKIAPAPASDARFVADRLLKAEHRILGTSKRWEPADADYHTPSSGFPTVAVGHHIYADADGAREAFSAQNAEMALRFNEEIYVLNDPMRQPLADATSTMNLGDQTRTMTGKATLDDGTQVDLTSVRWRRGAVELYVDVASAVGTDSSTLVRQTVQALDAAYTSKPMAGS